MGRFSCNLFFALALTLGSALADEASPNTANAVSVRPDPLGVPTSVKLDVYLLDIDSIDDVRQRFSVDLFYRIQWRDQRLAMPADQRSGTTRTIHMNEIWRPRGIIVNDRGLRAQLPQVAVVDDDGNVMHRQRMSGELAARMEFREFPFDRQQLEIDVVSYVYSPEEIAFGSDLQSSGADDTFSAVGWRFKILEPEIGEFQVPAEKIVRARITYAIEASRDSQYYLLTMFLPMSLIVLMAWTAFWLQPDIVPPRVAISTASIFSLIAFGFSIRLSLPPVSYMTRADIFVLGCTLLVFLALGVAVIGSRWAKSDRMGQALRLNAQARWAYIVLFLVVFASAMTL